MSEKDRRHQFLRELVDRIPLETQEDVAAVLRQSGFSVTQATVSRDIRHLQLIKVPTESGGHRYALPPPSSGIQPHVRLERMLAEAYRSVVQAENLVVLKMLPGNAHAVGAVLDDMDIPGLLGTIAGDDTVLMVMADKEAAEQLTDRLRPAHLPTIVPRS